MGTLANMAESRVAFLGHSVSGPLDPHELMTRPLQPPCTGNGAWFCSPGRQLPPRWFGLPWFPPEGGVGCTSAFGKGPESFPLPSGGRERAPETFRVTLSSEGLVLEQWLSKPGEAQRVPGSSCAQPPPTLSHFLASVWLPCALPHRMGLAPPFSQTRELFVHRSSRQVGDSGGPSQPTAPVLGGDLTQEGSSSSSRSRLLLLQDGQQGTQ